MGIVNCLWTISLISVWSWTGYDSGTFWDILHSWFHITFCCFFFLYRFQNVFWYIFVAVCFPLSVYLRGVSWDVLVIRIPESMHCCFLSRALFVGPAFGKIRIFKSPQEARYGAGGMISEGRPLSNTSPWFSWQDRTGKCVGPKALEPAA